jgi:hypothetical protein
VLTEQLCFITTNDLPALLNDKRTRDYPVLLRLHDGRVRLPMWEAGPRIVAEGNNLRDVSFPSDIARILAGRLGVEIGC